jgi:acyl transferase domain-containing protein/acyl carrier protein
MIAPERQNSQEAQSPRKKDVAVVGVACRLPGADTPQEFWNLIVSGGSRVARIPDERIDRDLLYDPVPGKLNRTYADIACLLDRWGPKPTSKLPHEFRDHPEPAFSTACDVAYEAAIHAGLNPLDMPFRNSGVFVGHTRSSGLSGDIACHAQIEQVANYLRESPIASRLSAEMLDHLVSHLVDNVRQNTVGRNAQGNPALGAMLAAKLPAQSLGFEGPAIAFNGACASSLQAFIQGVRAVELGRLDMAMVGGVSYCHSDTLVLFSQARSLSATGSCPWDAKADGLVVGEGVVMFLLCSLEHAQKHKLPIRAVVRSCSLASDGRGKSLWSPRREGQVLAMRRAHDQLRDGVPLQYVEAHATSTALGDATEAEALAEVLPGLAPRNKKVPIGSVKANIGHTLETAGAAGILKVILAIENEMIPPVANCQNPSGDIDWAQAPFRLPLKAEPWGRVSAGIPRRVAVNAFGIGGLNAHIVLDEWVPEESSQAVNRISSVKAAQESKGSYVRCSEEPIAIVGVEAVLPGALAYESFCRLVLSNDDPKSEIPQERWDKDKFCRVHDQSAGRSPVARGGIISGFEYDWRRHKVPPKQIAQASPLQFMILDAVDRAINGLGKEKHFDRLRDRTGVVAGTMFGGEFATQLQMGLRLPWFQKILIHSAIERGLRTKEARDLAEEFQQQCLKNMPALLDETGSFTASSLASRITKTFDLHGGGVAIDAGTLAAPAALMCCVDQLRSGDNNAMIWITAHQDMSINRFDAMNKLGLLNERTGAAPFDKKSAGSFPAEGCGVFILRRLSDACKSNEPVLGIIHGVGAGTNSISWRASASASARGLQESGMEPDEIDAFSWLGSGVPIADSQEMEGLAKTYGIGGRNLPRPITTPLARFGHLAAAAGLTPLLQGLEAVRSGMQQHVFGLDALGDMAKAHQWLFEPTQNNPTRIEIAGKKPVVAVHLGDGKDSAFHVVMQGYAEIGLHGSDESSLLSGLQKRPTKLVDRTLESMEKVSMQERNSVARSEEMKFQQPIHFDATEKRRSRMKKNASKPIVSQTHATEVVQGTQAVDQEVVVEDAVRYSLDDLSTFLVNFVVEQTGYPPDIVELDADLEADLGIDSIKKAQLFGEIGEYFSIPPRQELSLDEFPTLRHVLDFLVIETKASSETTPRMIPAADAGSHKSDQAFTEQNGSPRAQGKKEGQDKVSTGKTYTQTELAEFLVTFVVEQTGYPSDIVELDADLEADLGIDSIKKAQLFGEIGEYFAIPPRADLSLDAFPTLQHVLDFLIDATNSTQVASNAYDPNFKNSHPGGSGLSANAPSRESLSFVTNGVAEGVSSSKQSAERSVEELSSFLTNFVVEQTGYPPDIVELDADLEADLGIDSIKKAQLFGEIGEYFAIPPRADLSLDEFPTLRHVLEFLVAETAA